MPLQLPVPVGFFKCPDLSAQDKQRFIHRANASAMEVVHKTQLVEGPVEWAVRSDEVDVRIYKGTIDQHPDEITPTSSYVYMGITEVPGTLDEVVELFQTRTTAQAKQFATRFGHQLKDAIKLYSLVQPTAKNPMELVDLSWRAYKSPMSLLVAKRDACLLECNRAFTLNGRRGWVVSVESVDLACCPDLEEFGGLVRMHNYGSGHVFLESHDRPGCLEIRYIAHVDFRGVPFDYLTSALAKRQRSWLDEINLREMAKRRNWVSDIHMTRRCRNVTNIDRFLRQDRVSRNPVPAFCVPQESETMCHLCHVQFGWKQAKTNCFKCGQVVCKSCNPRWIVAFDHQTKQVRACVMCALGKTGRSVAESCATTEGYRDQINMSMHDIVTLDDESINDTDDSSSTYTTHLPLNPMLPSQTCIILDDYSEFSNVKV